ncbi:MAG: NnrS family protein [Sulfuricurvum sp.]|nr:NnrS family protein [Sulfuricurvum sp.]
MNTFSPQLPKVKNYFFSQPHQPFFLFGVVWAIVSMIVFTFAHKGVITLNIAENQFHLYSLAFIVFSQLFHGFLFTTFPRFCSSPTIPREVYTRITWLYQIGAALFFIGSVLSQWVVLTAIAVTLFAHSMAIFTLWWIYQNGQSPIKKDPFWILVAHFIGLGAHFIWMLCYGLEQFGIIFNWLNLVSPIMVNLFLIFLTFSVAQRMIPFFSHSQAEKSPRFIEITFALLTLKTLLAVLVFPFPEATVSLILAGYLLREFLRWKLSPFQSPAILWILHLALFWLPIGLFLGALAQIIEVVTATSFLFLGTHLLILGFLTTVLIGFGTRVTLGHSGQPPHADTLAIVLFWWTQVVIIARSALSIDHGFGASHPWIFDLTVTVWVLLFVIWGWKYGKILIFGKR